MGHFGPLSHFVAAQPPRRRMTLASNMIRCADATRVDVRISRRGLQLVGEPELSQGFLFGSAVAGFQVEMGCPTVSAGRVRRSQLRLVPMDHAAVAGRRRRRCTSTGDPPTAGPGFYELYPADLDRAANELHHNGFRLSLEWSRIFPTATDGISGQSALHAAANPQALAYYHALFAAMKERGFRRSSPSITTRCRRGSTTPSAVTRISATCTNRGWVDHDRIVARDLQVRRLRRARVRRRGRRWATLERADHRGRRGRLPVSDGGAHQSARRVPAGGRGEARRSST